MSETDTAPPGTLLISYILSKADEPLCAREINKRVERATGHRVAQTTVYRALSNLLSCGQLDVTEVDDTRYYRYR
jgi:hypothetical protein